MLHHVIIYFFAVTFHFLGLMVEVALPFLIKQAFSLNHTLVLKGTLIRVKLSLFYFQLICLALSNSG